MISMIKGSKTGRLVSPGSGYKTRDCNSISVIFLIFNNKF